MKSLAAILKSSLGNILEWYDFGLFTIFAPIFSRVFFPLKETNAALLATLSIFAIGFICRPVGAILFGYLGDTSGRARTLRLSILLIMIPTLLIGLIPSYDQIGIVAPIALVVIRMIQGLSIGGEYTGNIVYLAESAPKQNRGIVTAFASSGANIGILIATIVGIITSTIFTTSQLETWGWRLAYIASGIFCIFIYITRLQMPETKVFDKLKDKMLIADNPIKVVFQQNLFQLCRTLGLVCMGTTFYYFAFIYIPIYLQQSTRFSTFNISLLMSTMMLMMIVLIPLAGKLSDHFGRRKMLLLNAVLIMLGVIPGYYLLNMTQYSVVVILFLFTLFSSLEQGTTSIALVENFPPPARYTGVSLGYNIGNGFLGGTVPMICEWLSTQYHYIIAPAFYITCCAMVTGLVVWFYVPETYKKSLTENVVN